LFLSDDWSPLMVIGNGMIAKAFSRFRGDDRVLIFASGVANSGETDKDEFERERSALDDALRAHSEKLFVYFSTCSVDDKDVSQSPYVKHKLRMEDFITRSHKDYLICRLPQVVGRSSNRATLVNYLHDRVMNSEPFVVWRNAVRYLIDVDDVERIISYLIEHRNLREKKLSIVSRKYSVPEIIAVLTKITGRPARYSLVDKGTPYDIAGSVPSRVLEELKISFDDSYLEKMLVKYYA